jgi:hypothetical protein
MRDRLGRSVGCGTSVEIQVEEYSRGNAILFVLNSRQAVYERCHRASEVFRGKQRAGKKKGTRHETKVGLRKRGALVLVARCMA